jgi:type III secretory pathway component EscT
MAVPDQQTLEPLLDGLGLRGGPAPLALAGGLLSARIAPALLLTPAFGAGAAGLAARAGATVALVGLLLPGLSWQVAPAWPTIAAAPPLAIAGLVLKELLVGSTLGFLASILFHAAEAAGRLIDSMSSGDADPGSATAAAGNGSPLAGFTLQLAIVLFFVLGGHLLLLAALAESYAVFPLASLPRTSGLLAAVELGLRQSARLLPIALGLAAPVLVSLWLAEVVTGLVLRVAPALATLVPAAPARRLLAVLLLLLLLGTATLVLHEALGDLLRGWRALVGLLAW